MKKKIKKKESKISQNIKKSFSAKKNKKYVTAIELEIFAISVAKIISIILKRQNNIDNKIKNL